MDFRKGWTSYWIFVCLYMIKKELRYLALSIYLSICIIRDHENAYSMVIDQRRFSEEEEIPEKMNQEGLYEEDRVPCDSSFE